MSQRLNRINKLIKQEVSQLLLKEINFGDILVTVIDVATSPDLRQAKIKITILPEEKSGIALRLIEKNIYAIQQILNKRIQIRCVPKIIFEIDKGEINAQRVEELLLSLRGGRLRQLAERPTKQSQNP